MREDLTIHSIIEDVLKEKERELVFIDGWNCIVNDAIYHLNSYDLIPYTHIIFCIYNGPVCVCSGLFLIRL